MTSVREGMRIFQGGATNQIVEDKSQWKSNSLKLIVRWQELVEALHMQVILPQYLRWFVVHYIIRELVHYAVLHFMNVFTARLVITQSII
jgi:hypothetical protein